MGRESILSAINNYRPFHRPLPVMDYYSFTNESDHNEDTLANLFCQQLKSGGGDIIKLNGITGLQHFIGEQKQKNGHTINTVVQGGDLDSIPTDLSSLGKLHQVFIAGSMAVAENGAVWVNESSMINRILPFITEELFLIVYADQLVLNMHEAYEKIKMDEHGFGVFIAGPSKTADIEQSLVIGAHGAKKLTVLLL